MNNQILKLLIRIGIFLAVCLIGYVGITILTSNSLWFIYTDYGAILIIAALFIASTGTITIKDKSQQ